MNKIRNIHPMENYGAEQKAEHCPYKTIQSDCQDIILTLKKVKRNNQRAELYIKIATLKKIAAFYLRIRGKYLHILK